MEDLQTSNGMCCAVLQIYKAKPNTMFNLNKSIYSIFKSDKTHTEIVLNSHCIKFFFFILSSHMTSMKTE